MSGRAKDPHVLLGVSGAIAAYKSADIVRGLRRAGCDVTCALTDNSQQFVTPFLLANLSGRPVVTGQYQPEMADVRHVNLAFEVDLLLIAPATADVLARMAAGLASDFLTTFYLATSAPTVVVPAMNTRMWEHAATRLNVSTLVARGVGVFGPVEGELATLHSGVGRMAEPPAVVEEALRVLAQSGSLQGQRVLVTAGPTEEDIDPVRTITNRSSGRMGYALAAQARARGAAVVLVTGPTAIAAPTGVEILRVRSAAEMREAVLTELTRATIVLMTAAVADFRPARREERKVKKEGQGAMQLELVRTADILAEVGKMKGDRVVVGFAAEDGDLEGNARGKLERKALDLIVANDISKAGIGFGSEDNEVLIVAAMGDSQLVSRRPKREIARVVLDRVEQLLHERSR